jgi:hypothetical protein
MMTVCTGCSKEVDEADGGFCPECADEVRKNIPNLVFQCVVCGQSKKLKDLKYVIEGARPLHPFGDCFCYGDCTYIYLSSEIYAEIREAN